MSALMAGLLTSSAFLAVAAVAGFTHGGPGGVLGGVAAGGLALLLALAAFGLIRDPQARATVAARIAASRGQQPADQADPVAPVDPVPAEPATEVSQGFTVPANRAERRAQARAQRRR